MPTILETVDHRTHPLPERRWRLTQRWNDLLFAHWPILPAAVAEHLPLGLEPDLFDGYAWVGVVPFWMDQVRTRGFADHTFSIPGTASFPELNLRTYVRSRITGLRGVFFFSLDAASPIAVMGARLLFHLPYYPAVIRHRPIAAGIDYTSHRLLSRTPVKFEATYRGLGLPKRPHTSGPEIVQQIAPTPAPESIEHFLTERYALFTPRSGRLSIGHIHHLPWPLEPAEAEIRVNDLPAAHGIYLPKRAPILHFARSIDVFLWSLKPDGEAEHPPSNGDHRAVRQ
jgi:uncharacterized protein YqjF (DUF2071 family)